MVVTTVMKIYSFTSIINLENKYYIIMKYVGGIGKYMNDMIMQYEYYLVTTSVLHKDAF